MECLMKKWITVFMASLFILILAACSDTAEPTPETDKVTELTLEEVYNKSIERQQELTSVSADLKVDQDMTLNVNGESIEVSAKSDMKMDMVNDPLSMYLNGTTTMQGPESANVNMEMYMTEDGLFMHESVTNQWMKMPSEQFDAIMGQSAGQADPEEQLEALKGFINDFKFEQTDKEYKLTMDAAGEQFKQYMLEQMQQNNNMALPEDQQVLENMTFDKINYVITIDKETFDILNMYMVADLNIEIDGQSMSMKMDTKIVYNNFNGVQSIEVPQEVIDQAVEVNF